MSKVTYFNEIRDLCYIRRSMPEVISRRECINGNEWFLIFDDVRKKFYKLKGNAGEIWEMLNGENTVDSIVNQILSKSPDNKDAVIKDVCQFISRVGRKGLIKAAIRKVSEQEITRYEDIISSSALRRRSAGDGY